MKFHVADRHFFRLSSIFVLLLVLIPGAFTFLAANERAAQLQEIPPLFYFSSWTVIVYAGLQLARLSGAASKALVRIPFYAFCYIWLGVVPLYQALVGTFPRIDYVSSSDLVRAYLVVIAGMVFYEIGYFVSRLRRARPLVTRPAIMIRPSALLLLVIGAALLVAVIGFVLNDPWLLFSTRAEFGAGLSESGGVMGKQVQNSLLRVPTIILMIVALWRFRVSTGRDRRLFKVLLFATVPLALVSNFPLAISRTWFGTIVISVLLVIAITRNRTKALSFGPGLVLALLLIYPLGTFLRSPQAMTELPVHEALISTYTTGSFDVFAQIVNTVYFMDNHGSAITYGHQLLGPLLFWVPRSIWVTKPVGTGQFIGEHIGLEFVNISAPLWSEALVNFGLLGVAVFFFGYGFISHGFDKALGAGRNLTLSALVAVFFSGFQLILLRGDLITASVIFLPILVLAYFIYFLGRVSADAK